MITKISVTGHVTIEIGGKVVKEIHNLVVTAGLIWIASKLYAAGTPQDDAGFMAMGTGTTAAVLGDTDLETALLPRTAISSTVVADNTIVYKVTFAETGTADQITEAGLFVDAVAGNMIARTVFDAIDKQSDDQITATWTLTIN